MTGWSLELAVACAAGSAIAGALGRRHRRVSWALLIASVVALWASVVRLVVALVDEDTSLRVVVEQTRPGTGVLRRISGLWSGAEGSLLLYASVVASVLLVGHRCAPRWQRVGVGVIAAGLAAASTWGANPFERMALPPAGGIGMAPILEHGAMFVHPPLLYVGTALALAPALTRDPLQARRLTAVSLAMTAAALALGASWAYVELGWGGWWAWDPIENVGLVVWLVLAGAMHADRAADRPLTVALQALCWPAVLGGAALTRTSLRTSVHAFADAAELAGWLWPLVAVAAVGAVLRGREAQRSSRLSPDAAVPDVGVRRRMIDAAVWLLVVAAAVIALGTWRPFVGGDGTEGWFYTRALFPLVVVGTALLGLAPALLRAKQIESARLGVIAAAGGAAGAVIAVATGASAWNQLIVAAAIGVAAAHLVTARSPLSQAVAHTGVVLVLVATLGATAGSDADLQLAVGEMAEVAGRRITLDRIDVVDGPPARVAAQVLLDGGATLTPSVTRYPDRNLRLPEIATHSRPWGDVQAILRDVSASDGDDNAGLVARLTIRVRPLTQLVWWGTALLALALVGGAWRTRRPHDAADASLPVAFGPQ